MRQTPYWLKGSLVACLGDKGIQERLEEFMRLIVAAPLNVSGFKTKDELWVHGICDAVQTMQGVNLTQLHHAVDIGSGGGLPGMILAIMTSSVGWTLIESRQKRAEYLMMMEERLCLENVDIVPERAEDAIRSRRESADVVTARAVGSLSTTLELSIPYVKIGGQGLFPRGRIRLLQEIQDAEALCFELGAEIEQVSQPYGENGGSQILCVRKQRVTPELFPRKAKLLGSRI